MKKSTLMAVRVFVYILGLFVVALGVRISLIANLGLGPGTAMALTINNFIPIKEGIAIYSFLITIVVVIIQILILRRDFKPVSLVQIVFSFIYSLFIAYVDPLVAWWIPTGYVMRFIQLVVSVILTGLGIFFVVKSKIIPMPPECLIFAVQTKIKSSVGTLRTCYDCSNLLVAIILGFLFTLIHDKFTVLNFLNNSGIREGTVISAVFAGIFVNIFDKIMGKGVERLCDGKVGKYR